MPLKDPSQFKLIGKPVRRIENAAKLNGSAVYAIDMQPPGLLYASVTLCPTLGGRVKSFDGIAARSLRGVRKIVVLDAVAASLGGMGSTSGGVAVIADTPFHATRALDKVTIEWDHGPAADASSREIVEGLALTLATKSGTAHYEHGDVQAALASATKTVTAEYRVPHLAHATMEPMNCTVQFKGGVATVWAATQGPGIARTAVATALGIKAEQVTVIVPYLGGSFGRRNFTDFLIQAAVLARETDGAPVQLIWSREQDMTHDFYRPAYVSHHKAGLDEQGRLIAWQATTAGPSMGAPSFLQGANQKALLIRATRSRMHGSPTRPATRRCP